VIIKMAQNYHKILADIAKAVTLRQVREKMKPNVKPTSLLIGRVVENLKKPNITKVRVMNWELDAYIMKYFTEKEDFWVFDKNEECSQGDIVLIEELKKQVQPRVRYELKEIVFKVGRAIDPVTGRPCRGTEFLDDYHDSSIIEKYEEAKSTGMIDSMDDETLKSVTGSSKQ
ncbi:unnamed protein product, partial [Owenia fusiformis]